MEIKKGRTYPLDRIIAKAKNPEKHSFGLAIKEKRNYLKLRRETLDFSL